jgi:short-subunit dehydrogenase
MPGDRALRPIALVTGASAGIGRTFAERLAARGYGLVLVARDRERLEMLGAALAERHAVPVEVVQADLTRPEDVERVASRLRSAPDIDVLVNNAGFGTSGPIATTEPAKQDQMLRLHVLAVHTLTQAAIPGMVERHRGAMIVVSSMASFIASAGNANYCATKAWQRVYAESLAAEVARHGVVAQALCPGFTRSEFHARLGSDPSRIPGWLWLDATEVVETSLDAMERGGPVVVIPALRYRVIAFLLRHAPRALLRRGAALHQRARVTAR